MQPGCGNDYLQPGIFLTGQLPRISNYALNMGRIMCCIGITFLRQEASKVLFPRGPPLDSVRSHRFPRLPNFP
jgi:hypothetical protein